MKVGTKTIMVKASLNDLKFAPVSESRILDYVELLNLSLPKTTFTVEYLKWLYFDNPNGVAFGRDALEGDKLVAHYVCIPIKISGLKKKSLLSLNTATHPNFRGMGLFPILAEETFGMARGKFSSVVGVANARSVKVFTEKLGFELLGNLDLRFGRLSRPKIGSRIYDARELAWRSQSPGRDLSINVSSRGYTLATTKPYRFVPKLWALVHQGNSSTMQFNKLLLGLTLDWRKGKNPKLKLPDCLKPSPLHLIYRSLEDSIGESLTSWSFPDFDAF